MLRVKGFDGFGLQGGRVGDILGLVENDGREKDILVEFLIVTKGVIGDDKDPLSRLFHSFDGLFSVRFIAFHDLYLTGRIPFLEFVVPVID